MELTRLAEEVGDKLRETRRLLATAESCTGGWVAQEITAIPGCSHWFDRGFVTYTNRSKQEMLGVSPETIHEHGAVSEETVREMAEGALRNSQAGIALAVSGVAGPAGGTEEKPVGTVWFAWSADGLGTCVRKEHFQGDRGQIRKQAVEVALNGVLELLNGNKT